MCWGHLERPVAMQLWRISQNTQQPVRAEDHQAMIGLRFAWLVVDLIDFIPMEKFKPRMLQPVCVRDLLRWKELYNMVPNSKIWMLT